MKKLYFLLVAFLVTSLSFGQDMIITGAFDGPNSGGTPKGVELYVVNNIADLSLYGIGSANNGGGSDGQEFAFSGSATAGSFIYVATESTEFTNFFGFAPDFTTNAMGINGDDAVELFANGIVIDVFGTIDCDPNASGSTCPEWEHTDGWAYRNSSTGPEGSTFTVTNWTYSGINQLEGASTNAGCTSPFPIGTFTYGGTPCGISLGTATYTCGSNTIGDNNDTVTINIPYTGSDASGGTLSTTSSGSVTGDISVADGTITITGLSEGDAWDVLITGGNCDGNSVSGTVPAAECDPTPSTCYDLSSGPEQFETVAVTPNSGFANNGMWEFSAGEYTVNAWCGSGCNENVETWLILGPFDMSGVSDFSLIFDATESFSGTDLIVAYTDSYSGCPTSSSWTTAQTLTDSGSYSIDMTAMSGSTAFIGIQYMDDGGYSGWSLTNVEVASFSTCAVLGTPPVSNCVTCDVSFGSEVYTCATNTVGDNNDGVTIEIPYTGSESTGGTLSTTSSGSVSGDLTVADGMITITGLSEGDAWDFTITGGDCDGTTMSGTVASAYCDPVTTDLVINEILADPDSTNGDANGDGTIDGSQDEFVELYNIGSSALDLSDYTIEDGFGVRYTFTTGTMLPANSFFTIFGGGTPTGISGLTDVTSGGLGLNNSGDTVTVRNASGVEVVSYTYGSEGGNNQSLAREPDFTGPFVEHLSHTTNPVIFTPGAMNDGTLSANNFETVNFSMYPNPTNVGYVTITSNNSNIINTQVYDVLGKQVINTTITPNKNLDVSRLNSGVYIVRLIQNNNTITKKLVIR